jgi:O-antigen/teichoic acid export membrane protein
MCGYMSWMTRILAIIRADSGLAYVGLGNFIALAIHGLFWFILASMLTAEDYGELNYYISVAAVSSIISMLGLGTMVITYVAKGSKKIGSQANFVVLLSNAIGAVVLMIITNYYMSLLLVAVSFFSMTISETLGMKLYKKYFILMVAERATQIGLAIALYYAIGLQGIIVGYALGALTFSYSFFRSLRNISFSVNELKSRFSFMLHSYTFNISDSLALNADKLIIAPIFGFTVLGFYQLSFQFLLVLSVVPASLFYYLLPQFSSGNKKRNVIYVALVLATVFASIAPIIIPVLINTFFREYIDVILTAQIMSVGIVPMTINSIFNSSLLAKGHSKNVVVGAIVYVSSLLILFYLLGALLGVVGLGISVVISLSLQSLLLFLLSRRMGI